ncbi:hypothetical protein R6P07_000343 [Salmonella enterica]|nr:hypothetical protein [Salmonella enterica]
MRYILFILMLIGGLLSFNSYAVSCPVGATVPAGTYKPYYIVNHDGFPNLFINVGGCEYLADSPIWTPEGLVSSSSPFVSTGKPAKEGVSPSVDENNHSPEPSLPDVKPPQPDVTPPIPDTGTTGGSSGFAAELSSINSSSADSLYLSYPFDYNFNYTAEQNKQLAQAFLSKLSNVTPPSYYSVDHIYNMMERWQHYYNQLSTPTSSVTYLWNSSHFVGGEHRYLGSIVLAVNSCAEPDYQGHCSDLHKPLYINDPDYASRSDYKNGITRCMRNPNDPSCHSSGGSGDSSPDPVIPDVSGGSSDSSGSFSCPANQFYDPRSRQCLDYSVFHCPDGYNPVFSGSDFPTCVKDDSDTQNPGTGGGSGSGSTDNNDNGDVVAAINAFHADANKNHKETMNTFTDLPPATGDSLKGYLSSKVNSVIDDMKKEMTDDYNDALAEFKDVFGDIDSYIPDIKLSFDLPVQFTNGISGRCVPLVFDFNIALIGFQPYHFHAEGVQACQLYDTYIRSIVEYMLYFLTALACRRVFTRAAEFITSQP